MLQPCLKFKFLCCEQIAFSLSLRADRSVADFDASRVRKKLKKPKVQNIISLQYLEIDRPRGTDQIFVAEKNLLLLMENRNLSLESEQ